MLGKEQAASLARTVHLLRPAWSEAGIFAALGQVKDRDSYDVALAAIRAAHDPKAQTPGVIPTAGNHWNEEPPKPPKPPTLTRTERRSRTCETCGRLDGCTPPAHPFLPLDQASRNRTPAPTGLRETA